MMNSKVSFVLVIFELIILAFVPSNAVVSPAEMYWKTKLRNIPMPKILKDSLQLGSSDEIVKPNPNYTHSAYPEYEFSGYSYSASPKDYMEYLAIDDCVFHWGRPINKSQIPQDGRVVFFTDETLSRVGTKMSLHIRKINNKAKFLPLYVAKSLPSTSNKIQVILNLLSINPESISAQDIYSTMKNCEEKGVKDEKRYCATSLEGMIDYVTSILNSQKTKLTALSTEEGNDLLMEYTIQKVQKIGSDDNYNMVCHKMSNPYAVFLCHNMKSTDLYGVSLVDANNKQSKGVAVCHKDTSSWNPKHYAFEFLKSKPGNKPICHFISPDAVVWFKNKIAKENR